MVLFIIIYLETGLCMCIDSQGNIKTLEMIFSKWESLNILNVEHLENITFIRDQIYCPLIDQHGDIIIFIKVTKQKPSY